MPTRQDACQIHHPHFKAFVDQFQRDSQQQLHQQVAHDVLYSARGWRKKRQSETKRKTFKEPTTVFKSWGGDGFFLFAQAFPCNSIFFGLWSCDFQCFDRCINSRFRNEGGGHATGSDIVKWREGRGGSEGECRTEATASTGTTTPPVIIRNNTELRLLAHPAWTNM